MNHYQVPTPYGALTTESPTVSAIEKISPVWPVLSTVSMAMCVYHGYRRNDSIGWALGWGLLGAIFPVVVPVVAVAQGFGEPAKSR